MSSQVDKAYCQVSGLSRLDDDRTHDTWTATVNYAGPTVNSYTYFLEITREERNRILFSTYNLEKLAATACLTNKIHTSFVKTLSGSLNPRQPCLGDVCIVSRWDDKIRSYSRRNFCQNIYGQYSTLWNCTDERNTGFYKTLSSATEHGTLETVALQKDLDMMVVANEIHRFASNDDRPLDLYLKSFGSVLRVKSSAKAEQCYVVHKIEYI